MIAVVSNGQAVGIALLTFTLGVLTLPAMFWLSDRISGRLNNE